MWLQQWPKGVLRWRTEPIVQMLRRTAMRNLILAAIVAAVMTSVASAQVHVKGYTKKDGTYVAPHYRSSPNSTKLDNYSTRGNANPYTGKVGTIDPYASSRAYSSPYSNSYSNNGAERSSASDEVCIYYCPE
jgi:opacity protein-like surface antigen